MGRGKAASAGWVYKVKKIPLNPWHMGNPLSERDLNEIREEIFAGRTISAIKLYRQFVPGSGLAEAKDAIEEIERKMREESPERFVVEQPDAGEAKSAKSAPGVQEGKGCFAVLICVALATALTLIVVLWC
jgi:hypothetical protein